MFLHSLLLFSGSYQKNQKNELNLYIVVAYTIHELFEQEEYFA